MPTPSLHPDTHYVTDNHRDARAFTGRELNELLGALTEDTWLSVAELQGYMNSGVWRGSDRYWGNSTVRRAINALRYATRGQVSIISGHHGYKLATSEREARTFYNGELLTAAHRLAGAEMNGRSAVVAKQREAAEASAKALSDTLYGVGQMINR
jgi:hypothetical protein